MTKALLIAAAAAAWSLSGAAGAQQTIWRCGSSYAATPCPGGATVAAVDPRPAADLEAAQRVAEREQQLAGQLRAERALREGPPGTGLAGIRDHRADKAAARPLRKPQPMKQQRPTTAEPGTWPAVVPSSRRGRG